MKRGDINIFGTSFLDLLSGALAAVIILFVIIPKVSQQQVEVLEEIERLNVQVEELDEMAHRLRDYVPPEVMQELEEQMSVLRNTISDLTYQVEDLQEQLSMAQEENERLHEEVERLSQCCQDSQNLQAELERLREENERIRQENERLQQDNEQMQERLSELEQTQSNEGISDGKVFGIDAVVGITCMWTENIDIDLYVVNVETEEVCFFSHKATPFGNLMEDITSRAAGDDRYELFYQKTCVPGRYKVLVNIYGNQDFSQRGKSRDAHVCGYVVMNPGKRNQKKINYREIHLTNPGELVEIGILIVTENNISLQQN